ncbi:hypothetical protein K3X44_10060 [Aliiroseovarius crassostreae]|uniref:hypothetical protein n=1 Tax=Aliiroseovarius crassostreae TaxID=154981 RepID=UPI00220802FE|nr:hypothetical protein [Aliiroseovarius crassostreae]UWQ00858.1 hypothetical protein K3X44_10060 [Aliiroseovarius crassostreae]
MEITKVAARPDGSFRVTFDDMEPITVEAEGNTEEQRLLAAWFMAGNKAAPYTPTLEEQKASALAEARRVASQYRRQIAEHVPEERAIAWVLKAAFGSAWALHEKNPTLADSQLATAAQSGFAAEAAITGEDARDLRDRALSKSVLFFQATQVVEGMERLAEARIPAVTNPEELEATIDELRAQEEAAAAQLVTLKGGAHA